MPKIDVSKCPVRTSTIYPAEFAKVIKADSEKWGGIGRKLGITLD